MLCGVPGGFATGDFLFVVPAALRAAAFFALVFLVGVLLLEAGDFDVIVFSSCLSEKVPGFTGAQSAHEYRRAWKGGNVHFFKLFPGVLVCDQVQGHPAAYDRHLAYFYHKVLCLEGAPIRIVFRISVNFLKRGKNKLTKH